MSPPECFALPSRACAVRARVGMHAQSDGLHMARLDGSRHGLRPCVLACQTVAAGPGLAPLSAWWRAHAHRHDQAALVLGGSEYQMLQMPAPVVAADETCCAARWQIKDLIDLPVEQAAIDCFLTPHDEHSAAAARLKGVVARQSRVVESVDA